MRVVPLDEVCSTTGLDDGGDCCETDACCSCVCWTGGCGAYTTGRFVFDTCKGMSSSLAARRRNSAAVLRSPPSHLNRQSIATGAAHLV